MSPPAPDVLVLGGGGILGEAWINGVLAGLEEAGVDCRQCRGYVGTSAGSIVVSALAAGVSAASRLGRLPEQPPLDSADGDGGQSGGIRRAVEAAASLGSAAAAPVASLALRSSAVGGALVRRAALSQVPRGRRSLAALRRTIDELGVEFDGRLRISAVELESGRRMMFGAPGSPEASVGQAVEASCAIPGVFRPVSVDGRTYVDGGAWSPTNMDAAEAGRGDAVLCLNPTGSLRPTIAEPTGAIGPVSRSLAATEALALRRRGARVTTVNPDRESAGAMGVNLMRSGPRAAVIDAGFAQGRRLAASSG